jgi:hypothetical protein
LAFIVSTTSLRHSTPSFVTIALSAIRKASAFSSASSCAPRNHHDYIHTHIYTLSVNIPLQSLDCRVLRTSMPKSGHVSKAYYVCTHKTAPAHVLKLGQKLLHFAVHTCLKSSLRPRAIH